MVADIVQINNADTTRLQDDLHMGFWTEMSDRLKKFRNGADGNEKNFPQKVDAEFTPWVTAVIAEDGLYKTAAASDFTKQIKAKDDERDTLYKDIRKTVDTFAELAIFPEKQQAALKMQPVMKKYKINTAASYEAETVALSQWLQEQQRNYQLELAAKELGIFESIKQLKTLNEECRQLISQRNDERSTQVAAALREARKVSDQTWRSLVMILNAAALMDENEWKYRELFLSLNEEIKYFKRLAEQRRKQNARDKDGDEPTPEPVPEPTPDDKGGSDDEGQNSDQGE